MTRFAVLALLFLGGCGRGGFLFGHAGGGDSDDQPGGCTRCGDPDPEAWLPLGVSTVTDFETFATWGSGSADGIVPGEPTVSAASMTRAADGSLVVVYSGGVEPSYIRVIRFDGTAWVPFSEGSASGTGIIEAFTTALFAVTGADGTIYVIWSGADAVRSIRWNGTSWGELVAGSMTTGLNISGANIASLQVTRTPDALPAIVWAESNFSVNGDIYAARWSGSQWVAAGPNSLSIGGVSNDGASSALPSMTYTAQRTVAIGWVSDNNGIVVKSASETAMTWQSLGTVGGNARETSMATDSASRPVLVWTGVDSGNHAQVYLAYWTGAQWTGLAAAESVDQLTSTVVTSPFELGARVWNDRELGLTVAYGLPTSITDVQRRIVTKRWSGTSYAPVGADPDGLMPGFGTDPLSLVADATNRPTLLWMNAGTPASQLYARSYDGAAWQEFGAVSATGPGVSAGERRIRSGPQLTVDANGNVLVVWSELYQPLAARYWNGSSWLTVRPPTSDEAFRFDLTSDAAGTPYVALGTSSDLRVYRFDGTEWFGATGSIVASLADLVVTADGDIILTANTTIDSDNDNYTADAFRWSGTTWENIGALSPFGSGHVAPTSFIGGTRAVAFGASGLFLTYFDEEEGNARGLLWDGVTWSEVGGSITTGIPAAANVVPFVDESGGLAVAYANPQLFVLYGDAAGWTERGGSATGGGLSDGYAVADVSVAASAPIIAWSDARSGNREAYAIVRSGTTSRDLAPRTNGGISRSSATTTGVSIASNATTVCASWSDAGTISVRCRAKP